MYAHEWHVAVLVWASNSTTRKLWYIHPPWRALRHMAGSTLKIHSELQLLEISVVLEPVLCGCLLAMVILIPKTPMCSFLIFPASYIILICALWATLQAVKVVATLCDQGNGEMSGSVNVQTQVPFKSGPRSYC